MKEAYSRLFFDVGYIPPDTARLKERLADVFKAQLDIETGSHMLAFNNEHCDVARDLLGTLFATTDRVLKAEKQARFLENIASLRAQSAKVENIPMRSQLTDALLQQYLRQVAAQSRLPLAARVLDGPGCPSRPSLPQPIAYALAGGVLALVLAVGILAANVARRTSRTRDAVGDVV